MFAIVSKKVENKFGRDATHMLSMSGTAYNAAVTDLYKKMKEGQSQCGSALLQQYSPWLANFQDTQYQTMLEIPGEWYMAACLIIVLPWLQDNTQDRINHCLSTISWCPALMRGLVSSILL